MRTVLPPLMVMLAGCWIAAAPTSAQTPKARRPVGRSPAGYRQAELQNGAGKVLVPTAANETVTSAETEIKDGVETSTSIDAFPLEGDVKLSVTVVKRPAGSKGRAADVCLAEDKAAGGTPGRVADFVVGELPGQAYVNVTKEGLIQRNALFERPDGRFYKLTVEAKDKARTENATADTFLRSLSVDGGKGGATKTVRPKKVK